MVAPIGEEEVVRVIRLMDDLARPLFVLRAADGLLAGNPMPYSETDAARRRGAELRRYNAAHKIVQIIDKYVREE